MAPAARRRAFRVAARSWWRARKSWPPGPRRKRTDANAPPVIAGGNEVVKMKPGAWLRTASTSGADPAM